MFPVLPSCPCLGNLYLPPLCQLCPVLLSCFYSLPCPSGSAIHEPGGEKPDRTHSVLALLSAALPNFGSLVEEPWLSSHPSGVRLWAKCLLTLLSHCCGQGLVPRQSHLACLTLSLLSCVLNLALPGS